MGNYAAERVRDKTVLRLWTFDGQHSPASTISPIELRQIKSYIINTVSTTRKGARVVESAGLENRNTA
jgi:hypothetical protein